MLPDGCKFCECGSSPTILPSHCTSKLIKHREKSLCLFEFFSGSFFSLFPVGSIKCVTVLIFIRYIILYFKRLEYTLAQCFKSLNFCIYFACCYFLFSVRSSGLASLRIY